MTLVYVPRPEEATFHPCARPQVRLKLYEFEACPFCRKVREALCALDLDVDVDSNSEYYVFNVKVRYQGS